MNYKSSELSIRAVMRSTVLLWLSVNYLNAIVAVGELACSWYSSLIKVTSLPWVWRWMLQVDQNLMWAQNDDKHSLTNCWTLFLFLITDLNLLISLESLILDNNIELDLLPATLLKMENLKMIGLSWYMFFKLMFTLSVNNREGGKYSCWL